MLLLQLKTIKRPALSHKIYLLKIAKFFFFVPLWKFNIDESVLMMNGGSRSAAEVSLDEGVPRFAVVASLLAPVHVSAVPEEGALQERNADSAACPRGGGGSPSSQRYAGLALGDQPGGTAHSVLGSTPPAGGAEPVVWVVAAALVADPGADGLGVEEEAVGAGPAGEAGVAPSAGDAVAVLEGELFGAPRADDGHGRGLEGRAVGGQPVALPRRNLVEAWLAVAKGSVAVAGGRVEDGRGGAGLEAAGAVSLYFVQDRFAGSAEPLGVGVLAEVGDADRPDEGRP